MHAIVNKAAVPRRCYALTGTPAAQAPTDAWAQSRLVVPGAAPRTLTMFRELTMYQVSEHRWEVRPDATQQVMKILRPFIHVKKEECLDLPPMVYVDRHVELTKEQKQLAKEIQQRWVAELGGKTISPANAAVKLGKLLQIYQGAVIHDEGEVERVDCAPRLALLKELVEASPRGVLVFAPYKGVLATVVDALTKEGISTTFVSGDVSSKERDKRFRKFRSGEVKVLAAHPATTSHGLSFVNADTIIWYGPYFSVEGYLQANERIARPGQQHKMTIYHISASTLENEVYRRIRKRVELTEDLVELFQAVTRGELS